MKEPWAGVHLLCTGLQSACLLRVARLREAVCALVEIARVLRERRNKRGVVKIVDIVVLKVVGECVCVCFV